MALVCRSGGAECSGCMYCRENEEFEREEYEEEYVHAWEREED